MSPCKKKQVLANEHGVAEQELQNLLDAGYTLVEVESALVEAKENSISLDRALERVSKAFLNPSATAESEIVDRTDEYVEEIDPEMEAKIAAQREWVQQQLGLGLMNVSDLPKIHVNPNPDAAPYTIDLQNESISTLSGNVTLSVTDMVLPGNLPYALQRTYNSGNASYYDTGLEVDWYYDYSNDMYFDDYWNRTDEKKPIVPIGTGWSFNIPYISTTYYDEAEELLMSTNLNWVDGASYELNELSNGTIYMMGYPYEYGVQVERSSSNYSATTLDGIKYQFNNNGLLSSISDPYGNEIEFTYTYISAQQSYRLSRISTRRSGNTYYDYLNFTYTGSTLTVEKYINQQLKETVTYAKQNVASGVQVLTSVTDQAGRQTTYNYDLKNATFAFRGDGSFYTSPESNPYALLTKVVHPTGGMSEYTYETSPYRTYMDYESFKEVYRIKERKDRVLYTNNTSDVYNETTFTYQGGLGSDYGIDYTFATTVNDGLSSTTYDYRSQPNDNYAPEYLEKIPTYYNTKTVRTAGNLETTYDYTYFGFYPEPTKVVTTHKNKTTNEQSQSLTENYSYDLAGNVTTATNADNVTTTYTYSSWLPKSKLQPVTSNLNQYTEYTRNIQKDVTSAVIRENNASGAILHQANYGYDSYGNITSVTYPQPNRNIVQNISYSSTYHHRYPTQISVQTKNANGQTRTETTKAKYDPSSMQVTEITDGENHITKYAYDILGRMTKITHPDNSYVQYTYNDTLNRVQRTGETGIKTETRYNPLGWLAQAGLYKGSQYQAKTKQGYDAWGRIAWIEDAIGNRTSYTYHNRPWGEEVITTHPDGSSSSTQVNVVSRTETVIDEEGNEIITTFDKLGRATQLAEKIGSVTKTLDTKTYNYLDLVTSGKDANNKTTQYIYDALGKLIRVTNSLNQQTHYEYDRMSNLTKVTYPDNATLHYEYDELGRTIRRIDQSGKIDKYDYDRNGNLTKHVNQKGQTTNYSYSNRQFLLGQTGPTLSVTYAYNLDGTRKQMIDATGTTSYTYDSNTGELTRITYPDSKTINYTYNANGQRASLIGPFGQEQTFQYDNRNRLYRVNADGLAAQYNFFDNNRIKETLLGNDMKSTYTYKGFELESITHRSRNGSIVKRLTYQYDANKNITAITEGGVTRTYAYDSLNRIQTDNQQSATYSYNNRGNRSALTQNGQTTNYQYDARSHLLQAGNASFTHDDNGNMLTQSSPQATYEYDEWNRLTSATREGQTVNYKYNGDGLMVERIEGGASTRYYYDADRNIIAEGNVSGNSTNLKAEYIRGHELIRRQDASNNKAYYLHNAHGDVIQLRGELSQLRNSYTYDIWGNILASSESVENPFGYSGEFWDDTAELQYLRARWYDPNIGRFLQEDTYQGELTNPLTLNLYTYVINNPLIYVDPTGHWCESADGNWAHPGSCSSESSTWTPDYLHHGSEIRANGTVLQKYDYYNDYSLDELFFDWSFYGDPVFRNAPSNIQESLRTMAFQAGMYLGPSYFLAGVETGSILVGGLSNAFIKTTYKFAKGPKVKVNFQVVKESYLKRKGIDAHEVKKEYLGNNAPISQYDLSVNKSTGQLYILRKKGRGTGKEEPIPTEYFIK